MPSLRDIRNQLHSIKNIKKITSTMEMVASARLNNAQKLAKQSHAYCAKMEEIVQKLASASSDFSHPLLEKREVKKIGLIIVAADKGLCGPYNSNVFHKANQFLNNYHQQDVELFLFGRKALDNYARKKWTVQSTLSDWGGKITYAEIKDFADLLEKRFLSGELDAIYLIYTQFHNIARRVVIKEQFLPFGAVHKESNFLPLSYFFEPRAEEIYADILPRYCAIKIQAILNEAYASELAARIFAMKAAAKNAEEMIENLTLLRNKMRQTGITKEMLEITSGSEGVV